METQTDRLAVAMTMERKTVAAVFGLVSIIASLPFWIELALGTAMGRVPGWIDIGVKGWVAGWLFGLLLAGIATILWPKRWWWVLLVPVISFLGVLVFVSVSHVNW